MRLLRASWLIPDAGPPLEGGGLVVSAGRIVAVGPAGELARRWSPRRTVDFPDAVLLPPLVNAHAHLELTELGPPPDGDFVAWLLAVVGRKREAPPHRFVAGIRRGAAACLAGGQGTVADVLSVPAAAGAYPRRGPEVAVFPEVIAPDEEQASASVARALDLSPGGAARVAGVSPHAPYTAAAAAYRAAGREARSRSLRWMTHVAEHAAEVDFCRRGGGPVRDELYGRLPSAAPPSPGEHPVDWLDRLGILDPRAVLVHLVHLAPSHPALLARRGARGVLCPRSNRRLSGRAAPGRALWEAGVTLGLGTDSALSAGDLDLWADVVCAVEDYGWSPREAVAAATLGGAAVLGLPRGFAPGNPADILAVSLSEGRDVWDRLLAAPRPLALWLGGRIRWKRKGVRVSPGGGSAA